jgi:hypothetical protein
MALDTGIHAGMTVLTEVPCLSGKLSARAVKL